MITKTNNNNGLSNKALLDITFFLVMLGLLFTFLVVINLELF